MEKRKPFLGGGIRQRRPLAAVPRPYTLRVVRDHGGGLWTFEDDKGQLYLGVLSKENSDHRVAVEAAREVSWPTAEEHRGWLDAGSRPA